MTYSNFINVLQEVHPKIIAIAITATGSKPWRHEPIAVALSILNTANGEVIDRYQSYILVSKEAWNIRDKRAAAIDQITWEKLQSEGKGKTAVQEEIGQFLTIHKLVKKAFFLSSNTRLHRPFFYKILGGRRLTVPNVETTFYYLPERAIGKKRKLGTKDIAFFYYGHSVGWFDYPGTRRNRETGMAYSKIMCLRLLGIKKHAGPCDHVHHVEDICRIFKKLAQLNNN